MAQDSAAPARLPMHWVTTAQTGLADTFQMTLGGMFGEGPAFQSKLTTGLTNVFRDGDMVWVFGSDSHDVRDHANDWMAGGGYKVPVWKRKAQAVTLNTSLQRWVFPNVKSGAKDWLIVGNLMYQNRFGKTGFSAQTESYSLLKSTLPMGSAIYNQVFLHHTLLKRDDFNVQLKHGPAHTYAWDIYGTKENRIFRYQAIVSLNWRSYSIEGGYRKQVGLQDPIPHNRYWNFAVIKTFVK